MAHLDTYAPLSDADADANLGGLTLQGMDDNAAGLGVMLELAERLKNTPTEYGIRFVATSGEEETTVLVNPLCSKCLAVISLRQKGRFFLMPSRWKAGAAKRLPAKWLICRSSFLRQKG